MDICRIGLIGAGNVARRHSRVLKSFPDVHLTGITDVVPEAAAALAGDTGCRTFADAGELLSAGVDAAYICVPPFAHGAPETAVLSAGVPLFVEKPLAVTAEIAERVGARVAAAGVLTAVGLHWRYLDVVERARRLLDGRAVRLVGGTWLDKVPPVGWWPVRERSGGPAAPALTGTHPGNRAVASRPPFPVRDPAGGGRWHPPAGKRVIVRR